MRYSFVLATLAASAIATPYINVEVSEPGDVVEDSSRNNHHRGLKHHGRTDGEHRDRGRGWFSRFWTNDDDDDDDYLLDEDRRRNREGRRDNEDRRRHRNNNYRHGGRRDSDRYYNDDVEDKNKQFSSNNIIDDIFGTDYECIIQAESEHQEVQSARECCREIGGQLYDQPGRCILRDVFENPREEWRDCALEQRGANFADCYYREPREVDDSLSNRRRRQHGPGKDHNPGNHHSRSPSRSGDSGSNQRVFNLDRDDRSEGHLVCKIEDRQLDDEEQREITRSCCEREDVDGRLVSRDHKCVLHDEYQADHFNRCVISEGIPKQDVVCKESHGRRDL